MDDATAWVTRSCAGHDLMVLGPGTRRQDRPWSLVLSFDIRDVTGIDSRVWLKANGIGTHHEPGLIAAMGSLVPDLVPEVLAVDTDRGWSLTCEAGPSWRSAIAVADQWPLWEDLMRRYAAAQLLLASHRVTLLSTHVPEHSPATLPGQAAELIAELALLADGSGGLTSDGAEALNASLPAYRRWCRDLGGAGVPWTIQHDDLHSGNVCRTGPANGGNRPEQAPAPTRAAATSRVIDWGDASFGHPFGTLLTTLRSIARHAHCDVSDPRVRRVRDAYLEPFTTNAPRSELLALVDVALRVGVVTRALSWRAALAGAPFEVHREHGFPVRGWLQELRAGTDRP